MRHVAAFTAAAAVVTSLALPAAHATERTYQVPLLGCEVTIEVNDVTVNFYHRGIKVDRDGRNRVESNC